MLWHIWLRRNHMTGMVSSVTGNSILCSTDCYSQQPRMYQSRSWSLADTQVSVIRKTFPLRYFSWSRVDDVCKSVGPDLLPNDVLTTESVRFVLLKFMNKCFEFSLVPGSWQQAIIAPIPKSSSKDPFVPLNYRSISLLSCFYKMYSSLINNQLSFCCESNDLIVDEQNGFRPGRSCTDHICCLSSIIRNRNTDNLSTYCAFIDLRKAFDWVNRDL